MNGAVLVSGDFVRTGGMDMPNFALALHLADRGVSVHVVAYRVAKELAAHRNVRWHRVPKPLNSYLLGAPLLDHIGRRVARQWRGPGVRVLVNGGNCQIGDVNWVHYVHAAYQPPQGTSVAARAKGGISRHMNLEQERKALQMSRVVIANSNRTRHDLTRLLGIDDARIHTVYYGIDSTRFLPASDAHRARLRDQFAWPNRPQVAFVGALGDRRKGFDTLYAAWSRLCKTPSWDADLIVVGHGAEVPMWRARSHADGLVDRIRFLGFRQDVPDIIAACDALVSPARYEAFGLGVQEALCTGLPALVSAAAGVAERYPPELTDLLLADPDSSAELEFSLKKWRGRADDLRRMTTDFSASLRTRTWEVMASEIADLLY